VVEEDGSNIVQMASQGEKASFGVVVPEFNPVVITAGNEHWLSLVEVHASNRTIVFLISVN